jgi:hypothetical protein
MGAEPQPRQIEDGLAPDPRWPAAALRAAGAELTAYLQVVWQTTTAPRRFYVEWAEGRRRALNPLAAAVNAITLQGVMTAGWRALLGTAASGDPWWLELVKPVLVILKYCGYGVAFHGLGRLLGGRRPLRTTLGAILYFNSGPMILVRALAGPVVELVRRGGDANAAAWLRAHGMLGVLVVFGLPAFSLALVIVCGLGLNAVEARRGWRAIVASAFLVAVQLLTNALARQVSPTFAEWIH